MKTSAKSISQADERSFLGFLKVVVDFNSNPRLMDGLSQETGVNTNQDEVMSELQRRADSAIFGQDPRPATRLAI